MPMKKVWFGILTLVALHNWFVLTKKCVPKEKGCGCDFDDKSGSIDFTGMKGQTTPMFSNVPDKIPMSTQSYNIDLCTKFDCNHKKAYVCLKSPFSTASIGMDKIYEYDPNSKLVTVVFSQRDDPMTVTRVILHCQAGKSGLGEMSPVERSDQTSLTEYATTLDSRFACVTSGGSGLSIGSVLCIFLSVSLVLYFAGGILINKYIRKKEDVFPNQQFWSSLPGYIKEGCRYTTNRMKYRSAYEAV